jgi:ABC-2 type transport system ATP-binding protein
VIRLEVAGWKPEMAAALQDLPNVENLVTSYLERDSLWEVSLHAANSREILPRVIEGLNQNGTRLVNMNIVQPSLEDVFIHLTGKALRD